VSALAPGPHVVLISIVGVEQIPLGYYRHKLAAEEVVRESGLPWTTLRTTQFHSLLASLLGGLAKIPGIMPIPSDIRFQPIAAVEVGARLADLALGSPAGRVPDLGGPEIVTLEDLARRYLSAIGRRRRIADLPLGGAALRALRRGANLVPGNRAGGQTFDEYLAALSTR
jgi:uncharacterized protein YbjT (DUF2867 family)